MVVESGEGLVDSDSYVSVEFADDYFSARGIAGWSDLEVESKEQALVRATDYIDNIFQWHGKQAKPEQALRFPRTNLRDFEGNEVSGIPVRLKQAVCDAAVMISGGTELFQTQGENGDVVSENITSLSFTYSKTEKAVTSKTLYDSINTKLRGLFRDSGSNRVISGKVERV